LMEYPSGSLPLYCFNLQFEIIVFLLWLIKITLLTDMMKQIIIYANSCTDRFVCLGALFIYSVCLISVC